MHFTYLPPWGPGLLYVFLRLHAEPSEALSTLAVSSANPYHRSNKLINIFPSRRNSLPGVLF
jgi:hypothetical protein